MKTTLLLVFNWLDIGGVGSLVLHLVSLLDPNEFDIHLLICDATKSDLQMEKKFSRRGACIHKFSSSEPSARWEQMKLVKKISPDLILTNDFSSNVLAYIFSKISRASIVRIYHCSVLLEFAPIIKLLALKKIRRLIPFLRLFLPRNLRKNICNDTKIRQAFPSILRMQYFEGLLAIERMITRKSALVCVSHALKSELSSYQPYGRLTVIHNSIPNRFMSEGPRANNTGSHLITVCRLDTEKNVDLLLRVFSLLTDKYKDIRLTIVGDGPLMRTLIKLSFQLKIEKKVDFLGNRYDVDKILHDADIFVSCSSSEAFGLSLLEAMAAGLPLWLAIQVEFPKLLDIILMAICLKNMSPNILHFILSVYLTTG